MMDKIKIETETAPGTDVEVSKYWKKAPMIQATPRRGLIGWLGRLFGVRAWAWKEEIIVEGATYTAEEMNAMILHDTETDWNEFYAPYREYLKTGKVNEDDIN
jgi:hypothetical protein